MSCNSKGWEKVGIWDPEVATHFHIFTPATQVPRQRAKPGSFLLSLGSPCLGLLLLWPPLHLRLPPWGSGCGLGLSTLLLSELFIVVVIKYLSALGEKKTKAFPILTANLG